MFEAQKGATHKRGDVFLDPQIEGCPTEISCVIAVGVPIWYVSGIIITFSPEVGDALNLSRAITAAETLKWQAIGLALGSGLSGIVSEMIKSRKKVVWVCFASDGGADSCRSKYA